MHRRGMLGILVIGFVLLEVAIIKYPDEIVKIEKIFVKQNNYIKKIDIPQKTNIIAQNSDKVVQSRVLHDDEEFDYSKEIEGVHPLANPKKIAYLTFDDGPYINVTPKILDVLDEYDIQATFFMQGWAIRTYPSIAKRVFEGGHTIGNHTYSHKKSMYSSLSAFKSEIEDTDKLIYRITGSYPKLFRPPYGSKLRADYINYLKNKGFRTILWNDDSGDARHINVSSSQIRKNVSIYLKGQDDAVIILHDSEGHINTANALRSIIKMLWQDKYGIRPIEPDSAINASVELY